MPFAATSVGYVDIPTKTVRNVNIAFIVSLLDTLSKTAKVPLLAKNVAKRATEQIDALTKQVTKSQLATSGLIQWNQLIG